MATMITAECINCGACEPECPNTAIYQGAVQWQAPDGAMHPAISNDIFYIVPEKCTECVGFHDQEACAAVCPVDCCVPDPKIPETHEVLLARARTLHPGESIPDDAPSRFKKVEATPAAADAAPTSGAPAPAVPGAAPRERPSSTRRRRRLAIPSPEDWEVPIHCYRCEGVYGCCSRTIRRASSGARGCLQSTVPTLSMVQAVRARRSKGSTIVGRPRSTSSTRSASATSTCSRSRQRKEPEGEACAAAVASAGAPAKRKPFFSF
jgi:ferredoxin